MTQTTRPPWATLVEWTAVGAFAALWIRLAWRLGGTHPSLWLLPALAVAGMFAADFFSGLVHWFCDSVFEEDTRLVGPLIIHPFREHHRDPRAMTHHGFMEVTGNSCLALAPALALAGWLLPAPVAHGTAGQIAQGFVLAFTFAAFWTNQLHKWAHAAPSIPPLVAWLQRRRLILAPMHHGLHHRPAGHAYCVLTGWMNPLLDRIGFFPGLERLMSALGFRWFSRGRDWEFLAARETGR